MTMLNPGDDFPTLDIALPRGDTLALPGALAGGFGVILFYRGSWCPYCNAQLRAFQRASGRLSDIGTKVVALSVDDEATTRALIAKHGLTFPVGYGADARAVATATGAFLGPDADFIQSTGFVLDSSRTRSRERVLQRCHRPAGSRRRHRSGRLPARTYLDGGLKTGTRPGFALARWRRDGVLTAPARAGVTPCRFWSPCLRL